MSELAQRVRLLATAWSWAADGQGRFRCPHCGDERACRRTLLQRRLVVLERAVASLGRPERFLTCQECGHAYSTSRLGAGDPRDLLAEDELGLLAIVSAMILSDSAIRGGEKAMARDVILCYTGRRLDADRLEKLLRRARPRWGDPVDRLARLPGLVREQIRRAIVAAAYRVCTADGELHPEESRLLVRMGEALDLGPREIRHALREAKGVRGGS